MPEDVSQRTREQFEKLRESNDQLKAKLDQMEKDQKQNLENVYESLRPKGLSRS